MKKRSIQEVKTVVREYAESEYPGQWDAASICISRGCGKPSELFVTTPIVLGDRISEFLRTIGDGDLARGAAIVLAHPACGK